MSDDSNVVAAAEELSQQFSSELALLDGAPPDILYHYTDPGGLLGILETKALWFSQAGFLNDSAEMTYADSLAKTALSEKLESLQNSASRALLQSALNLVNIFSVHNISPYIACFCEKDDLLSQWRGYGSSGCGFALGFQSRVLEACVRATAKTKVGLVKVIYDVRKQRDFITRAIDAFCDLVADWQERGWKPEEHKPIEIACNRLCLTLAETYIRFKHPGFVEEHEWRLVILRNPSHGDLTFRASNSRLVPYFKIGMYTSEEEDKKRLPLVRVVCGPTQHQDVATQSLALRIEKDFPGGSVKIDKSSVPFRF